MTTAQRRARVPVSLFIAVVLVTWEGIAAVVNDVRIAPTLWHLVFESYPSFALFEDGRGNDYGDATVVLARHASITALRAVIGVGLGSLFGFAAGLGLYALRSGRRCARALLAGAMNIPLFALVPLFVYWFSGLEIGIVSYVVFASGVLIASATHEAAMNVPVPYLWQALIAGAGRKTLLRSVVAPAVLPELIITLRWVLGLSWAFTLGAEYLSGHSGCGFLAYQSYLYADVGKLVVLAGAYAALGTLSLAAFNLLHARVFAVRPQLGYRST